MPVAAVAGRACARAIAVRVAQQHVLPRRVRLPHTSHAASSVVVAAVGRLQRPTRPLRPPPPPAAGARPPRKRLEKRAAGRRSARARRSTRAPSPRDCARRAPSSSGRARETTLLTVGRSPGRASRPRARLRRHRQAEHVVCLPTTLAVASSISLPSSHCAPQPRMRGCRRRTRTESLARAGLLGRSRRLGDASLCRRASTATAPLPPGHSSPSPLGPISLDVLLPVIREKDDARQPDGAARGHGAEARAVAPCPTPTAQATRRAFGAGRGERARALPGLSSHGSLVVHQHRTHAAHMRTCACAESKSRRNSLSYSMFAVLGGRCLPSRGAAALN